MKFLNLKIKITLWYTFFMFLIIIGGLLTIVEFTDLNLLRSQKERLVDIVEDNLKDIRKGDIIEYFDDGVYLILYDKDKNYVEGSIPNNFPLKTKLKIGAIRELSNNNVDFYVYDRKFISKYGNKYWLRGVVSNVKSNEISALIIKMSFIILPILIILSSFIGYFITQKTLSPVKQIQETAENITKNNKLSLRIGLKKGKDEISKLAETIDKMLDKLEKSFQKEKQFTSDASHELRTPISVILAESEFNFKHENNINELKMAMYTINKQAQKMSEIIEQLLMLTREDSQIFKLNLESINIINTINEVIQLNTLFANKKNITIEFKNNLPTKSYNVDKLMFERVIQNLIQNAIIYGNENGFIKINSFEKGIFLAINVEDNGLGISPDDISKIWNRFYQSDKSRGINKNTSGLGLSIVKLIAEKHNGYVEVNSTLGKGSSFTVFFKKL